MSVDAGQTQAYQNRACLPYQEDLDHCGIDQVEHQQGASKWVAFPQVSDPLQHQRQDFMANAVIHEGRNKGKLETVNAFKGEKGDSWREFRKIEFDVHVCA